jgi:hypothetical protein
LYIPYFEFVAAQFDSVLGLPAIDPELVHLAFVVRNRGDSISAPAKLVVWYSSTYQDTVVIPPLRPGQSQPGNVTFEPKPSKPKLTWICHPGSCTRHARAELLLEDADTSNNRLESPEVLEAMPELDIRISTDEEDVRMNVPFEAEVVVTNLSRFATLEPIAIGFAVVTPPGYGGEVATWVAFGTHDMAALPPGGQYVIDRLTITPAASYEAWRIDAALWAWIGPMGSTDSTLLRFPGWWKEGPTLTIHPDYRACEPALLRPDTVVWAPVFCAEPWDFALFELPANPDYVYWIEQADTSYITTWLCTDEGERLGGWRTEERYFPEGGTYWIVDGPLPRGETGPRSLLLRARRIQAPQ